MNKPFDGSDEQLDARARRIDLAHEPDFAIGPVEVQPSLRRITGPTGEAMLEPKVMQVLVALGAPVGTILSRDDLIERCWEGRVVGDTSINRVISLLRSGLKATVGEDVCVENVPKVGYRLLVASDWMPDEPSKTEQPNSEPESSGPESGRRFLRPALLGIVLVAVLFALGFAYWKSTSPASAQPLTVVMLPLDAGEGVDPLYATGLESELRGQLATLATLEVSASESARLLLEKGLTPQEIGRKLKVDYIWSGEFDVEPDRVTLAVSLLRVADATISWRGDVASALDAAQFLPVRHSRAIAEALGRAPGDEDAPSNVGADDYRLYLTAMGLIKTRGESEREAALNILEQVVERNPTFGRGVAGLAKAWYLRPIEAMEDKARIRERGAQLASQALALDPNSVDALKVSGMTALDGADRLTRLRRAVELDQGDSEAWYWLSIQQQNFLLSAQNSPADTRLKMVAIDPLWPPSWGSSDAAMAFARPDDARKIEADILSAAVTPSQSLMAEARLARIDGDMSEYIRLARQAAQTQSESERLFGKVFVEQARMLLGLAASEGVAVPYSGMSTLSAKLHDGELPSPAEFAAENAWGSEFWDSDYVRSAALPLMLREGRGADIVALYDARFASPEEFAEHVTGLGLPDHAPFAVTPFVISALQEAGRGEDAQALLAGLKVLVDRWKAADTGWLGALQYELLYAALAGQEGRALAIVRDLPEYGWPYTAMPDFLHANALLLDANPVYGALNDQPEVRAVLDPIRADVAREREEVLALGA